MLSWAARTPLNIIGGVGGGKSDSIVEVVGELNRKVNGGEPYQHWLLPLPTMEPYELSGPYKLDGTNTPPAWLPFNCAAKGIINLEELDRAEVPTANAALQILLGGCINGNRISDNAHRVCTMNGASDIYTRTLSDAAATRVCHIYTSNTAHGQLDCWMEWAKEHDVSADHRAFMEFSPPPPSFEDFEELAKDNFRTRAMASRIYQASEKMKFRTDDILWPMIAGTIGQAGATVMQAFLAEGKGLPTPKQVLAHPATTDVPVKKGQLYLLITRLCDYIQDDDLPKLGEYLVRIPAEEIVAYAIRRLHKERPAITKVKVLVEFIKKNARLFIENA